MSCPLDSREETLLAYSSGELDQAEAATVEAHLETCSECKSFVTAQKTVWDAMDLFEAPAVSMDFDRRLYRRIEEQVSWWDVVVRPLRVAFVRRGLPIAAAAALTITAGILIERAGIAPTPAAHPQTAQFEIQPDQLQGALDEIETLQQFATHATHVESDSQM